jgi:predicted CxxxxCH...CXXCH cytochrome family protein
MRYLILFIFGFTTLLFSGCSDENSQAVFGAHPDNWYNDHPGNIAYSIASFVAECGSCHGLDLMGSGDAPSCFSTSFNGNSCHPGGPVPPHPLDGSFLNADSHGPVAKSDLTVCQACHSNKPTGGPGSNPQFNVGIFGNGCEDCHGLNYAHPSTWAGPGTRFHYSAGNIQQACTLCHGAALDGVGGVASSCYGCHAEVVNFTLDCTYCHGMPPDGVNGIDHGTVADISAHDVCVTCHGMKESDVVIGTFSNVANYALFDYQTDTIGDHWDGNINMNSDTGYDELLYGCTTAGCHGLAGHTLSDSGLPVVLGAYGAGGVAPHTIGQDWLLPNPPNPDGHVAAVDATCVSCHTLTGGGQDPACQDCHVKGDPLVLLDCTSCHSAPPNTDSIVEADRPDRQAAHNEHDGFTASTMDCSACHQGGGTGELSHYDRLPDGTTPDYPADVVLASSFNSLSLGVATYINGGQTCSGVNCHGGLITPNWYTGSIDVNTDCTDCHSSGTSEANSYNSGKHTKHVALYSCTVCHNTDKLATNHFTDLENPAQWLDTAGETIDGGATSIPETNYIEGTKSCSPDTSVCHDTRTWE